MGAAAVFFFVERGSVAPRYRTALTLSGLIVGIAAFHYSYMKTTYVPGEVFPTEYRYIDWIITTPLMLLKFPALLGLRGASRGLLAGLIGLDVIMIATGYLGEIGIAPWLFFSVGTLAWLGIVGMLYSTVRDRAASADEHTRWAIKALSLFVTVGWAIYPLGFVLRVVNPELGDITQLVYNVGDVVNKVGFGLVAYAAAVAATRADAEKTENVRPLAA